MKGAFVIAIIMEMTNDLQSFDNKAYVAEEFTSTDPDDHNRRKHKTKEEELNNNAETPISSVKFVKDMSPEEIRQEKRGILKNVIFISFSFLLLFTAFQSMSFLQSSINKVRNVNYFIYANVSVSP